jgi:toxin FitB
VKFLLDTCVISELIEPQPLEPVIDWFRETPELDTALSVMTLGELQKGIDRLATGRRRLRLAGFLDDVVTRFDQRLLPVTVDIARQWGTTCAAAAKRGKTLHGIDAIIAATARVHGLAVVTRNVADFAPAGVATVNPFVR